MSCVTITYVSFICWYFLVIVSCFVSRCPLKMFCRLFVIYITFVLCHGHLLPDTWHTPYNIYIVHSISFQTFFEGAFKIVIDSWKFSMVLLYILWDNWPILMISGLNEQLRQELEYTLLKPDCHTWWISKMQSGRKATLEERYTIKFCFKLGRNATETNGMLQIAFGPSCMNRASVFEWHKRFKEGRESVKRWWEVWEK